MDWIVSPQSSYVEALTLKVIVFGDRAFKEVLKVKWGHKGGVLTLIRRGRTLGVHVPRRKAKWGHSKVAISNPWREVSQETNAASALILDLQPPVLWEINFWRLSHLVRGPCYGSPSRLRHPSAKYFCYFYWDHMNVDQLRENLDLKMFSFPIKKT